MQNLKYFFIFWIKNVEYRFATELEEFCVDLAIHKVQSEFVPQTIKALKITNNFCGIVNLKIKYVDSFFKKGIHFKKSPKQDRDRKKGVKTHYTLVSISN